MENKEWIEDSWLNPHCRLLHSNRAKKAARANFCPKIKNYFRIVFLRDTHFHFSALNLTFWPLVLFHVSPISAPAHVMWCLHYVLHQPQIPKGISPHPPSFPFWNRKLVIAPPIMPQYPCCDKCPDLSCQSFPHCSSPLQSPGLRWGTTHAQYNQWTEILGFLFFPVKSNFCTSNPL